MKLFASLLLTLLFVVLGFHRTMAQQPMLSSYPSAPATIYLDFDGQAVNGTSWNWNGPLSCGSANLTNTQIVEIFNRVAEDYRPFNINITTDSTKYLAAPVLQRTKVIITTTSSWYGSAGGVAFLGSFTWGDNTPAFVFSALLGYNTKRIAEAASHEAGHTLGLRHQAAYDNICQKTSEYHWGMGTGEIGWAPIMGAGYYQNLTLWNNGANPYGCSEFQDDLSIITSAENGFGYRADDHSNQISNATSLLLENNHFNASGIIERSGDKDMFKFTVPVTGLFHLDGAPYSLGNNNSGSNLDMQLQLYNSAGQLLNVYNPKDYLNLAIDTNLTAGEYYISIEGKGNIYAPEYASLGSYQLNASFTPPVVLPLRNFSLTGFAEGNVHRLNWTIDADETVIDQRLEASSGPAAFHTIASIKSTDRSFKNLSTENYSYYRLEIRFDNNKEYYSNTLRIQQEKDNEAPHISGGNTSSQIAVISPGRASYLVTDYSGRVLARGTLASGSNIINTTNFSSGLYLLQINYADKGFVEKFLKP